MDTPILGINFNNNLQIDEFVSPISDFYNSVMQTNNNSAIAESIGAENLVTPEVPKKTKKTKQPRKTKEEKAAEKEAARIEAEKLNHIPYDNAMKKLCFDVVRRAYDVVNKDPIYKSDTKSSATNGGEVYTPDWCVVDMLNLIDDHIKYDSVTLDPCCGTGNITIDMFGRKLALAVFTTVQQVNQEADVVKNILVAVRTLYAIDINPESVQLCRLRLYKMLCAFCDDLLKNSSFINKADALLIKLYGLRTLCMTVVNGDTLNKDCKCIAQWEDTYNYMNFNATFVAATEEDIKAESETVVEQPEINTEENEAESLVSDYQNLISTYRAAVTAENKPATDKKKSDSKIDADAIFAQYGITL